MRPIPAPRIGDSHGLLRAIERRGRLRTDEFVTEFTLEELFAPGLENALGRLRHFVSYARSTGLVKEDRGIVELTEVGRRYVRAGDESAPFDVSPQQAEWLRRQLREKHMTDSIFHGMAIGLSLLSSVAPGSRVSTLDFGRSLAYLGRAGWDNENTFQIQGERYLTLLADVELIDGQHRLTATGEQVRGELTLPVHMSLPDIAAQLNPGGADAVRAQAEAEWAAAPASAAPASSNGEGQLPEPKPDDATQIRPPVVPRASDLAAPSGDPLSADPPGGVAPPASGEGYETVVGGLPATPPEEIAASAPPADTAAPPLSPPPVDVTPPAGAAAVPPAGAPAPPPPAHAELRGDPRAFVDPAAIRGAAESAGLRLPASVYANVAAALAVGKHVILTGAPGSGKTSLALAVARAAAQAGRAHGATLITARHRWDDRELLVDSAKRGRWVIVDELERARLDRSLGELSSFLAGLPVLLASGEEAEPDSAWRLVATAARTPRASAALLRRFAVVDVPAPAGQALVEALNAAAGGDETAAAALARLLPLAELARLGAGVFLDAARHAAARNAAAPAGEATLARDAYAAYIAPLLGDVDEDTARRIREIVGEE